MDNLGADAIGRGRSSHSLDRAVGTDGVGATPPVAVNWRSVLVAAHSARRQRLACAANNVVANRHKAGVKVAVGAAAAAPQIAA